MSTPKSMMGVTASTASHLPILEKTVRDLPDGSLVIEHGAGLYSTVLLARLGVRVLCVEPQSGWNEWARFVYGDRAEVVEMAKRVIPRLGEAALVFVDGPASERGSLMQACLDMGVPLIVAHDTRDVDWPSHGYQPHMFTHPRYTVLRDPEGSRGTTLWRLKS